MLRDEIQTQMEAIAFMQRTGIQLLEVSRGFGKVVMPLAGNENHVGGMYMGALSTLAEAGAAASVSTFVDFQRFFPVITKLDIDFLKPALTDAFAQYTLDEAHMVSLNQQLEENGRCQYIADLPLTDANAQIVAQARVTVKILSHR